MKMENNYTYGFLLDAGRNKITDKHVCRQRCIGFIKYLPFVAACDFYGGSGGGCYYHSNTDLIRGDGQDGKTCWINNPGKI